MTILQALILGVVQGITEFLPVSSSGHLILIPELFGWEAQSLAFDAMIHVATLAAIVVALWSELSQIGRAMLSKKPSEWKRLGLLICAATIPVVLAGLLFKGVIETQLRSPYVVAISLAVWGVVLYAVDRGVKKRSVDSVQKINWRTILWIGFAQAIALIPGTSRSGITITAGLFMGLNRETAARFSFLLGIPAIALAGASAGFDLYRGVVDINLLPLAVGFLAAFVTGILTIQFLLALMKRSSYAPFAIYRVILAIFILTLF